MRNKEDKAMRLKGKQYWLIVPAILFALTTVYPVLWALSGSLSTGNQATGGVSIIPYNISLLNYIQVFEESIFLTYINNTIIYAITVMIISTLINSMAGYALARLNFPGKNFIFTAILSTMMIPFAVIMIPLFLIVRHFGWVDSLTALIVPSLVSSFGIFLLRQFYMGIPRDLEDAAKVDGLSVYGIYQRIVLPISKPILYALCIFSFLGAWNNYLWPLIVNVSKENWVITTGIASFSTEHSMDWNMILAGAIVSIIPTLILFSFFQKQLVEGIKMTGIK
jgi:multiple sugar transport system permease protein